MKANARDQFPMSFLRKLNLFLITITLGLIGCGSHSTEENTSVFSEGATVLLSGTSQKSTIKINEPVQIIATTKNGKNTPQYFAVSSKQDIANVAANSQVITIIGIKLGKTKVIVIDNANGLALAEFDIEVVDDTESGTVTPPPDDDDIPPTDEQPPVFEDEIGPIGVPFAISFAEQIINFKSIPFGRFIRGDHNPAGKAEALPKHSVQLTTPFWISEFEITNEQYIAFLNDNDTSLRLKDGVISGDYNHDGVDEVWLKIKPVSLGFIESNITVAEENKDHPVVEVSWFGAMAYCKWLSVNQSGTYRLPTDGEWEYAVRGNQANDVGIIVYTRYPWGLDTYSDVYANVFGKTGIDTFSAAAPINQFILGKTLLGLQDSIGNVAEWCFDTYAKYDSGDKVDPSGPDTSGNKVYRGGSWNEPASQISVSNRSGLDPTSTSPTLGFRIVRFANGTDPLGIHESVSPQ